MMENENLAEEQRKELAPPPPSGAPLPETYIRTFPADTETVKVGGQPDLVPHTSAQKPTEVLSGAEVPPAVFGKNLPQPRSPKQQSWGTAIAILIIVAMVVIGAFYAWGKRIAEQGQYPVSEMSQ